MARKNINVLRQRVIDLKADGRAKAKKLDELEAVAAPTDEQKASASALAAELATLQAELQAAGEELTAEQARLDRDRGFEAGPAFPPPAPSNRLETPAVGRGARRIEGPFANLGEQLMAVREACRPAGAVDPRLGQIQAAATGLQEAVGADGGFLVQPEFSTALLEAAHETGQIASRVRRIPAGAGANSITFPTVDETSRADGSRWGGVVAYWDGEAEQYTAKRPKFSKLELKLGKLTGLCYATDEMLQDATALGAIVGRAFTEEFGFKLDDAIFRGNGVGMPLGLMNAACLVSVAKEASQTALTINEKNVLKMWARLPPRLRAGAVWLINADAEMQLPQMVIGNQPVYMPAGGLTEAPLARLLGRPVVPVEQAETLGTKGDIVLAALDQYVMYEKGGVDVATSMHVRFEFGEQAFRFTLRVDGKPAWKAALTPFKGSATLSPFISLDTRA